MAVSSGETRAARPSTNWHGRRVTLMGLGRHGGGLGAARFLLEQGARLTISDHGQREQLAASLQALAGFPLHAVRFGRHDPRDFTTADCVVANPAVRPDHACLSAARAAGVTVTSEIELLLTHCPARVIGVTGSNGKSTTAAMLAHVLTAAGRRNWLGGNIGGSLLGDLEQMHRDDWVVLELSSFQLAHLSDAAPRPELAVITNCTPNHLDWHDSFALYARAKRRILGSPTTRAIVDPTDPVSSRWPHPDRTRQSWPLERVGPLALPGRHNRQNAALAAAAAEAVGVSPDTIRAGLAHFVGLEHRLQPLAPVAGRRCYNDSKATTPAATRAALDAVRGPLWLLAGGVSKGADFDDVARHVVRRACGAAVFGESRRQWQAALSTAAKSFRVHVGESLREAFDWCWQQSSSGDALLLSPACASHDQFQDYQARGAAFGALVEARAACTSARPT